jgi:uroporphyrinogen III methyltransferase/synthase
VPAQYVRLYDLEIVVVPQPGWSAAAVREAVAARLESAFHVLRGGNGEGTPFGAVIHHAELVSEVLRTSGVQHLERLTAWFDNRAVFGKTLLLPRPEQQARVSAQAIRERGAVPVVLPMIESADPPARAPLERALSVVERYGWGWFTSAHAVARFLRALRDTGRDARALGRARIGAIGPKTAAALEPFGLIPDLVAKEFVAESLAQALLAALERAAGSPALATRVSASAQELGLGAAVESSLEWLSATTLPDTAAYLRKTRRRFTEVQRTLERLGRKR